MGDSRTFFLQKSDVPDEAWFYSSGVFDFWDILMTHAKRYGFFL
jgi:hypothetical protein